GTGRSRALHSHHSRWSSYPALERQIAAYRYCVARSRRQTRVRRGSLRIPGDALCSAVPRLYSLKIRCNHEGHLSKIGPRAQEVAGAASNFLVLARARDGQERDETTPVAPPHRRREPGESVT